MHFRRRLTYVASRHLAAIHLRSTLKMYDIHMAEQDEIFKGHNDAGKLEYQLRSGSQCQRHLLQVSFVLSGWTA